MSIHRLNTFIKDNYHDIIDYWTTKDNIIRFVRVVSRKTGQIYMVKVSGYNIPLGGGHERETMTKAAYYYLEELDEQDSIPDTLYRLYDTFMSAFPEHRQRFVLHQCNYFMESRETIYRISNMPTDGYYNVHLFVELEWFYENLYVVNHEIDRNLLNIFAKAQKIYNGFVPTYTEMIRQAEKDVVLVQSIWGYFLEQMRLLQKTQKLFTSICHTESTYSLQLEELSNIRAEELSFQDTVRRSCKRKSLHEKMVQLRAIHLTTLEKLLYFQTIGNNILLRFLYFLSEITLLLGKFHAHFVELETLVPKTPPTF